MVLETNMKLYATEPDFLEKIFLLQNLGKWTKNGPKTGIFEFIETFGHSFLLNLFYNKNLYYFLCPGTNPIFRKIFVPEIWAKCSQPIRLQDFLINHFLNFLISRTNKKNSLIFCMLIQVHMEYKLIQKLL